MLSVISIYKDLLREHLARAESAEQAQKLLIGYAGLKINLKGRGYAFLRESGWLIAIDEIVEEKEFSKYKTTWQKIKILM